MINTLDYHINSDCIDSSCAILLCTCEEHPKLIDYNDRMLALLTAEGGNPNWKTYLDQDIFFMIPLGEWNYFTDKIQKLITFGQPVLVRHRITRNDGLLISLTGWLNLYEDHDGHKKILLLYPVYDMSHENMILENSNPYLMAFRNIYNLIFEYDMSTNIVSCIFSQPPYNSNPAFYSNASINEFEQLWLEKFTHEDDCCIMKHFFEKARNLHGNSRVAVPFQIDFRSVGLCNQNLEQTAIAIPLRSRDILICIKDISNAGYDNVNYSLDDSEEIDGRPGRNIFIRTFGHFDVFLDGSPIVFPNSKEKELLALLVDRNGGSLTSSEAVACLWENEPVSDKIKCRYRKLALGLKKTLEKHNIGNLVINDKGVRHINKNMVVCDYFEMIDGNESYHRKFHNSYMSNYSWSESTLGTLWDYS